MVIKMLLVQEIPTPQTQELTAYPRCLFSLILCLVFTHFHLVDEDSLAKDRVDKLRHILPPLPLCVSINCQRYRRKPTKACLEQLFEGHVRLEHKSLMLAGADT